MAQPHAMDERDVVEVAHSSPASNGRVKTARTRGAFPARQVDGYLIAWPLLADVLADQTDFVCDSSISRLK